MAIISTSVSQTVNASISETFAKCLAVDPRLLFQKHWILPGIANVTGHKEAWSAAGQKRALVLTDGSSVNEELIEFNNEHSYAYRSTDFTGLFSALVSDGRGEWHFTKTGPKATQIDWTYSFAPKSRFFHPLVWLVLKLLWPGYMRAALHRIDATTEIIKS